MAAKKLIEINATEEVSRPADFALANGVPAENYVSTLFTSANTSLTGLLPYPTNTAGTILDRNINVVSAANVTVPDTFTDLLIRATVASGGSLAVTMPSAIETVYGDAFPAEGGEWLVTITKTGAAEAYVRSLKMEVANA